MTITGLTGTDSGDDSNTNNDDSNEGKPDMVITDKTKAWVNEIKWGAGTVTFTLT